MIQLWFERREEKKNENKRGTELNTNRRNATSSERRQRTNGEGEFPPDRPREDF